MSLINDIGIPAGIGIAIIAVIYLLLKNMLSAVIGIPIWLIACFVVGAFFLFIIPSNMLLQFWKFGKEGFTFMDARRTGTVVTLDIEVGTGNAEFILGKKADPKDPIFLDEQSGIKMDPTMVAAYADPLRCDGGLNIVSFGHDSLLPQNHRNHIAIKRTIEYLHSDERMKQLLFMTDKEIVELLKKPEHFLEADIKTKVGKYFKARLITEGDGEGKRQRVAYFHEFQKTVKDDATGEDVVKWFRQEIPINSDDPKSPGIIQLIRIAKSDLEKLPLMPKSGGVYFCMNEAFKYNPVSYTAQHAAQLKHILQQMADMNAMKLFNWWTMGLIAMGIIGVSAAVIVLGYKVLGMT